MPCAPPAPDASAGEEVAPPRGRKVVPPEVKRRETRGRAEGARLPLMASCGWGARAGAAGRGLDRAGRGARVAPDPCAVRRRRPLCGDCGGGPAAGGREPGAEVGLRADGRGRGAGGAGLRGRRCRPLCWSPLGRDESRAVTRGQRVCPPPESHRSKDAKLCPTGVPERCPSWPQRVANSSQSASPRAALQKEESIRPSRSPQPAVPRGG